jgi:hypothetical protein
MAELVFVSADAGFKQFELIFELIVARSDFCEFAGSL